ncbi:hypothetical protein GCM10027570_08720 [Streptomonospora sediminis]
MPPSPSDAGIVPARLPAGSRAREALHRDGAVVLTGLEPTADALAVAAALVHGSGLRQLFPVRERRSHGGGPVRLHADSFDTVVDIAGVPTRRRDPDEDAVFVQCLQPAPSGGDSFAADAYAFADACAAGDPDLWEFLTGADVDLYGAWHDIRGVPAAPRVARHVEYTRTGRRIVRRTDGAAPLHRDPRADEIRAMLDRFQHALDELESALPRFRMGAGDILALDNYRCWHGRDAHSGDRSVRILTARTAAAR